MVLIIIQDCYYEHGGQFEKFECFAETPLDKNDAEIIDMGSLELPSTKGKMKSPIKKLPMLHTARRSNRQCCEYCQNIAEEEQKN